MPRATPWSVCSGDRCAHRSLRWERSRGNKGTDAARDRPFEVAPADQNAAWSSFKHRVAVNEASEIAERALDQLRPPGVLTLRGRRIETDQILRLRSRLAPS